MAKVIVQNYSKKLLNNGKEIYKCAGTIDGEIDSFDMWNEPVKGEEFEGEVKETQFGKSVSKPRAGGFGGGGGRFNDPETRKEIIRQNAATSATQLAIARAGILERMGKVDEAIESLKPTKVLLSAVWIAKYSVGEWTPTMPTEAKKEEPQPQDEEPTSYDIAREEFPHGNDAPSEEVTSDGIPF